MEEEYLIWKRYQDSLRKQLEEANTTTYMTQKLLLLCQGEILRLKKAGKVPKKGKALG